MDPALMECVVNISEGRDSAKVSAMAAEAGACLLDVHGDPDHHRSVVTLAGPRAEVREAARSLARAAVGGIDISAHAGAHPRIGALDVVPFVSLSGPPVADGPLRPAVEERDAFALWAGLELHLPCFVYGPERSLPEVRRGAWSQLRPDAGPDSPHPSAGACAVGARPLLVAYNLWLADSGIDDARAIAAAVRSSDLRTLALQVGEGVQVACNLVAPWRVGPGAAFDSVAGRAAVRRAELVGLLPSGVLEAEPAARWAELGLDPSQTIEARLEQAGLDRGKFIS